MNGVFNGDRNGLIAKIVAEIIIFLIGQGVGLGIWLVQLGDRMINVEARLTAIDNRMTLMDDRGTRALVIVEDRQKDVLRRLEKMENLRQGGAVK